MTSYKRIIIVLDEKNDMLEYTGFMSRLLKPEEVCFVYNPSRPDVPESVSRAYPELNETPDRNVPAEMIEDVSTRFDGEGFRLTFEHVDGHPLPSLLRIAERKDTDLIIVSMEHAGHYAALGERLARKAPCSALVVPRNFAGRITRILVPVDFSESSKRALDVAVSVASAAKLSNVTCLHSYTIPVGYGKTGLGYDQFSEVMRSHAERDFDKFTQGHDQETIALTPKFQLTNLPADAITDAIKQDQADLVIMGARGRSATAAVLLGSVTERIVQTAEIPVLAVKKKGMGMGLLEALLSF